MTRRTRSITASILTAAALGSGAALATPASAQPFFGHPSPQGCIYSVTSDNPGGWQGEGTTTIVMAPAIKHMPAAC